MKLIQSILKGIASLSDNMKPWYQRALGCSNTLEQVYQLVDDFQASSNK